MIFIDSNIPMYLIGSSHPHKIDAQWHFEAAISAGKKLVTDTGVFQEILHRYVAIKRKDAIQPAFDAISAVVDQVFVIELKDVERAKEILFGSLEISARDSLHLAIMERFEIGQIMSFDRGFDEYAGVRRLSRPH